MGHLFHIAIYQPIYNALALLVGVIPGADVGIAIIILTIVIKLILLPLSLVAIKTQVAMKQMEPALKKLKSELKGDQQELAKRTMQVYKDHKINPFANFALLLIQLPVILGLYYVFRAEGAGGGFDPVLLYPFVHFPDAASFTLLGLIDLTVHSLPLAILVAVLQFLYAHVMVFTIPEGEEKSFQSDLARSMKLQMRYVFPVVMGFVAYALSSATALYFVVSNLFALGQELAVKHSGMREPAAKT